MCGALWGGKKRESLLERREVKCRIANAPNKTKWHPALERRANNAAVPAAFQALASAAVPAGKRDGGCWALFTDTPAENKNTQQQGGGGGQMASDNI